MFALFAFHFSYLIPIVLATAYFLNFVVKLYNIRRYFRNLERDGQPMPPHHPIFGHLLVTNDVLANLPRDAHAHYLADQIRRKYPDLGPVYYLDMWPFAPPFLVCVSPTVISQFTTRPGNELPNHPGVKKYLLPITGGRDLASMEGEEWKHWRKIYNPGFGAAHVTSLVPAIVEEVAVFVDILKDHARKGNLFSLDEAAINLTMDVIGRVALDHKLNAQITSSPLPAALRRQVTWCSFGAEPNPFDYVNPLKPLIHWYNSRIMNNYMKTLLEARYPSVSPSAASENPTSSTTQTQGPKRSKAVIDLAYNEWLSSTSEKPTESGAPLPAPLSSFASSTLSHMLLFLLGGHDTTATTLVYTLHTLSLHPSSLLALRREHTAIFGANPSLTPSLLSSSPHLLSRLPYTTAIIRETLRLYPVVTAPRAGRAGYCLVSDSGQNLPTEGCLVWSCHHGLHRRPEYWPRAEEFLPERWLAKEGDELYPIKDAWRPFEFGPRACIGRELAMTELKVVLVMVCRGLDVREAYGEWDAVQKRGWWGRGKAVKSVDGERAYQIQLGSARASDGFPCRVREWDWEAEGKNEDGECKEE